MKIKRFYTAGRAIMAENERGESWVVAVCEFDDSKPGQDYNSALKNADLIAQALTEKYAESQNVQSLEMIQVKPGGKLYMTFKGMQKYFNMKRGKQ